MSDRRHPDLNDHLADALRRRSDRLVDHWIHWITAEIALRPTRMLPREAIRNNMPPVIRAIAEFLRTPVELVRDRIEDDLTVHAKVRHDQGYDIEELLAEYHGLERIVIDAVLEALEEYPGDPDRMEIARIFLRLREGLAAIAGVTVSIYRQTDVEHERELHRQLEEYVRAITHELKAPLQSITAGAGMLEEAEIAARPEERRRYLELIHSGIRRALRLIDDIRTLALSESAQRQHRWQPLPAIVDTVLNEVWGMAAERDVHIEVERPLPGIDVAPTPVEIGLMNLVTNAIKYSDPEKDERWVRIRVRPTGDEAMDRWEVRVSDNGLGIPDRLQPQVFERHFRAHPGVDEGTGLGLAITRQVIEQMGGRVDFESEEGSGSNFWFVVPGLESGVGE